jgi:hypothetical protein
MDTQAKRDGIIIHRDIAGNVPSRGFDGESRSVVCPSLDRHPAYELVGGTPIIGGSCPELCTEVKTGLSGETGRKACGAAPPRVGSSLFGKCVHDRGVSSNRTSPHRKVENIEGRCHGVPEPAVRWDLSEAAGRAAVDGGEEPGSEGAVGLAEDRGVLEAEALSLGSTYIG